MTVLNNPEVPQSSRPAILRVNATTANPLEHAFGLAYRFNSLKFLPSFLSERILGVDHTQSQRLKSWLVSKTHVALTHPVCIEYEVGTSEHIVALKRDEIAARNEPTTTMLRNAITEASGNQLKDSSIHYEQKAYSSLRHLFTSALVGTAGILLSRSTNNKLADLGTVAALGAGASAITSVGNFVSNAVKSQILDTFSHLKDKFAAESLPQTHVNN